MELEDSPGLEVRALLEGGALHVGIGCGGDGGVGLTLVSYLRGAGATGTRAREATATVGVPWLAAGVTVAGGAAAAAVG